MSRIEKALEKAMQLRESGNASSSTSYKVLQKIEESLGIPEFHAVKSIVDPAKVDRHIVCLTDTESPGAEQYRKLRARILSSTHQTFQNTLLVTSADIGEGKSVTAVNFAIALAKEIDHTVLLVDADLRKPAIHTYLGIRADRGLSQYLEGKVELSDVLINTGIGKLVFLPAGTPPPNPAELLSSNRMKELAQEMKHRYADRYIIYDSSPILACADTISLSNHVDGIILVIQAARTSEKTVKKALGLLNGTPILGVVYNNVPDYLGKNLYPYNYYRYKQGVEATGSNKNNGKK